MQRDVRVYLMDVLLAGDKLNSFIGDTTLEEYVADDMRRSAVEGQLGIIGEAMREALSHMPTIGDSISEHERIISFRNRLVHGYRAVDHEVVWRVLKTALLILRAQVRALLQELDAKAGDA